MYFWIWIGCSLPCAYLASKKNRSAPGWFLGGMVFGLFALIAILLLSEKAIGEDEGLVKIVLTEMEPEGEYRDCPFCAERIKKRAIVCKHCKRDVPPEK